MDQAYSRRPASHVEARGDCDAGSCGICGGINWSGRRFQTEYLCFPWAVLFHYYSIFVRSSVADAVLSYQMRSSLSIALKDVSSNEDVSLACFRKAARAPGAEFSIKLWLCSLDGKNVNPFWSNFHRTCGHWNVSALKQNNFVRSNFKQ